MDNNKINNNNSSFDNWEFFDEFFSDKEPIDNFQVDPNLKNHIQIPNIPPIPKLLDLPKPEGSLKQVDTPASLIDSIEKEWVGENYFKNHLLTPLKFLNEAKDTKSKVLRGNLLLQAIEEAKKNPKINTNKNLTLVEKLEKSVRKQNKALKDDFEGIFSTYIKQKNISLPKVKFFYYSDK